MLKLITFLFIITAFCINLHSQIDTCIYYNSGELRYRGTMCDGCKCGEWFEFDKNQNKIRRLEFENCYSCKVYQLGYDTTVVEYYEGIFIDSLVRHGRYDRKFVDYDYEIRESWWHGKLLNADSFIYKDSIAKTGMMNKTYVGFSEHGSTIFYSGVNHLNELCIYLDENNTLEGVGNKFNGVNCGNWFYFENGELSCRGSYYNDYLTFKTDTVENYLILVNKDGIKAEELFSKELIDSFWEVKIVPYPIKDGPWIYFNAEGIPIKEEFYKKGDLIWSVEY